MVEQSSGAHARSRGEDEGDSMSQTVEATDQEKVFLEAVPRGFYVDPERPEELEKYLNRQGFIGDGEELRSLGKAGEGNMNLTLRVVTSERSLVLKQARPWVEKYPQIAAPIDRALVEIAFYEAVEERPAVRGAMPRLLGSDPDSRLLILEDLGEAHDFTKLYAGQHLGSTTLDELIAYLVALDTLPGVATGSRRRVFENRAMRALNHEHIFRLPLAPDNGLDLDRITAGLAAVGARLMNDQEYVSTVTTLGEDYLADGDSLVHGDYFPGSWLRTASGVRIIDPEFCFLGPREFDVGFMLGHLHLAGQPAEICEALLSGYRDRANVVDRSFTARAKRFAGVEIMRRLIGVAQLPLECDLARKEELLLLSRELVLG
jgi:5-methylthioribose kinase